VAGIIISGRSGLEWTGSDDVPSFLGRGGGRSRLSSIADEAVDEEFEDSPRLRGDVANWGESNCRCRDSSTRDGDGGARRGMGTVGVSACMISGADEDLAKAGVAGARDVEVGCR